MKLQPPKPPDADDNVATVTKVTVISQPPTETLPLEARDCENLHQMVFACQERTVQKQ